MDINFTDEMKFKKYDKFECYYIYLLIKNKEVVYVGRTNNLDNRIKSHKRQGKDFDEVKIMEIGNDVNAYDLTELAEYYYIKKYKPKYNGCINYPKRYTTTNRMTKPMYTPSFLLDKFIEKNDIKELVVIEGEKFYDSRDIEGFWSDIYGEYRQLTKHEKELLL